MTSAPNMLIRNKSTFCIQDPYRPAISTPYSIIKRYVMWRNPQLQSPIRRLWEVGKNSSRRLKNITQT